MSKGYIYVIDPHVEVRGRSVVKIGFTTRSPVKRLQQLQTSLPHRASLIHTAQFPDVKWAERRLHQALSSRSVREKGGTEFFFLSPKEAIELVNLLAYQVSVIEAKRALDWDLEQFIDKISNGLAFKIAGLFAFATLVGAIILFARGTFLHSFGVYFIFTIAAAAPSSFFGGMIGMFIGKFVERKIWKEEIALEHKRLLEKYPAAKL